MTNIFDGEKYKEASLKAFEFIKRQLNVNNYSLYPKHEEDYDSGYTGRIIAKVDMPPDAKINFPSYIYCDQFYDEKYQGVVSGKHKLGETPAMEQLKPLFPWSESIPQYCHLT